MDDGTEGPPVAGDGDVSGQDNRGNVPALRTAGGAAIPPPPPPPPSSDDDEEGMLRMSFMEHLEELRTRIIRALWGLAVAFIASLLFANYLWTVVTEPAVTALKHLGVNPPRLVMIEPMEGFSIIWVKMPLLVSIFLASPWILYQVWAFIAPGLYKRERRMATPFILTTAGLFIAGGLFAYYVAFRFGLEFLLGLGLMNNVQPMVTITEYFDLFVNVTLGVALVFELPVLIFFLTLIRVASPRFLLRHSRYAILAIVIAAAIITPTPDVFNLMLFAIPMNLLYFMGLFASYLLVLRREGRSFPWRKVVLWVLAVLIVLGTAAYIAIVRFGYKPVPHWPFLAR
ncbi:MAG: twin-arginine translocase subunit TatC [Bryobacteraceae bacterium]|jgi:sec-independent protein translocase protein TatC